MKNQRKKKPQNEVRIQTEKKKKKKMRPTTKKYLCMRSGAKILAKLLICCYMISGKSIWNLSDLLKILSNWFLGLFVPFAIAMFRGIEI